MFNYVMECGKFSYNKIMWITLASSRLHLQVYQSAQASSFKLWGYVCQTNFSRENKNEN